MPDTSASQSSSRSNTLKIADILCMPKTLLPNSSAPNTENGFSKLAHILNGLRADVDTWKNEEGEKMEAWKQRFFRGPEAAQHYTSQAMTRLEPHPQDYGKLFYILGKLKATLDAWIQEENVKWLRWKKQVLEDAESRVGHALAVRSAEEQELKKLRQRVQELTANYKKKEMEVHNLQVEVQRHKAYSNKKVLELQALQIRTEMPLVSWPGSRDGVQLPSVTTGLKQRHEEFLVEESSKKRRKN